MSSNIKELGSKKLGFYLSFKKNEKEIYEQIKSINNYTQVIKGLIKDYLIKQENNNINNQNSNTITMTIDDLCRVISSVNISSNVTTSNPKEISSKDLKSNQSSIPEDMLIGL